MDDNERNYFQERIQNLEKARRRWKVLALLAGSILGLVLLLGGIGSMFYELATGPRQRAIQAEYNARTMEAALAAEQARQQAESEKARLEKQQEASRQGPSTKATGHTAKGSGR
jgi:hypothetical protein